MVKIFVSNIRIHRGRLLRHAVLVLMYQITQAWWVQWTQKYWHQLVPRTKWSQLHRSLRPGDIAHIIYTNKYSPPQFCLCRVAKVFPDEDGVVRTVEITMRPRHSSDKAGKYVAKPAVAIRTAVQRLAVLLPVEEQGSFPASTQEMPDTLATATSPPVEDLGTLPPVTTPTLATATSLPVEDLGTLPPVTTPTLAPASPRVLGLSPRGDAMPPTLTPAASLPSTLAPAPSLPSTTVTRPRLSRTCKQSRFTRQ